MNTSKDSALLEQWLDYSRQTALLNGIQATLEWDERTGLPIQAAEYRAEQITTLAGMVHSRNTAPQLGEWLAQLLDSPLGQDPNSPVGASLRRGQKNYHQQTKLPQSLVEAMARATAYGQHAWSRAKQTNDFAHFVEPLTEVIRLRKEEARLLQTDGKSLYDVLLDQYEEDANSVQIKRVFDDLQGPLVQLVRSLQESPNAPNGQWLARHYPVPEQRQTSRWIAEKIGFSFERGRIDETEHPFCTTLGPNDHRILTRYDESHFNSGFFGTLHEAGHGMYEQGLPTTWFGLAAGQPASLGIHESQSRLWENMVGRSQAFWRWCFPEIQKRFPNALKGCTCDQFYRDLNRVQPSLIRVDADEATYNLHVLIRFEIEQLIINEDLAITDLPSTWNELYAKYLGVRPDTDSVGVLQDVHWSAALIGYFPTYTLGNIYAAQLMEAAARDLGDLHSQFAEGEFQPLLVWLRKNVHDQGHCLTPGALMQKATGQDLSSRPLMNYLRGKLSEVYQLRDAC